MSAEGKKRHGISGASNAKNIPFRYGGSKCNLSTKIGHSSHHSGSTLVRAMRAGVMLSGFDPSEALLRRTDLAMSRCTHPLLT